jgi:tetratricopeptide (TPR) repeat protein
MRNLILMIPLVFIVVSCASRNAGWDKATQTVSMSAGEVKSTSEKALAAWKDRKDQSRLEESLAHFEKLHGADPQNLNYLIYLTRGYYFLADSHLEKMELKKKTYEKAAGFGEKAMATNEAFRDSVSSGKSVEESLGTLTQKEVPAIYWSAASLGKWAKASGIAAALKYKTRIKAMIEQVEKLQSDYFFGATSRYWGGFYAVAPSFAGGDLNKSKMQFDKSLRIAPEYLGTKVLMAEVYYTKKGEKTQFEQTLKDVLASKFDTHPEIGPENALEKKKATELLKNMDDLF